VTEKCSETLIWHWYSRWCILCPPSLVL